MQKKATQALHMPGERIMKIAEELYQAGFISYPRTETDSFPPSQDLMVSLSLCLAHSQSDLLQQQQNILSILITCCCHTDKAVYNMTWHSPASSRMSTAGMTSQNFIHTHMGHKAAIPVYHNRRPDLLTCYASSSLLYSLPAVAQHQRLYQPSAVDEQYVQALVREHEGDARWGSHAQAIVHGNMWKPPGNGGHDDKVSNTLPRLSMQLICKCM